jgi:hypothetical protein
MATEFGGPEGSGEASMLGALIAILFLIPLFIFGKWGIPISFLVLFIFGWWEYQRVQHP